MENIDRKTAPGNANSLLLHICCGPCACMPAQRLLDEGYAVTGFFCNPNIQPLAEYLRRREAADQCAEKLGIRIIHADQDWDIAAWLRAVQGRDKKPERCHYCCASRLVATRDKAIELGFALFSTSLLYSRYQPHDFIAGTGQSLGSGLAGQAPGQPWPQFVYRDFRKDWQAGIDKSRAWGLYRQQYCGCVYSEAERYDRELKKLQANKD